MSETILEIKELKKILRRQSHPPRTFSRYQKKGKLWLFWGHLVVEKVPSFVASMA